MSITRPRLQLFAGLELTRTLRYTMVFGIPIEEPRVAELVRKVLRISIVGVFFVIVSKVTKWLTFKSVAEDEDHHVTVADLVIGILIGYVPTKQARPALTSCHHSSRLLVPLCGYAGAQQRNRNLLGCFYGWSLGCGVCGALSAFMMTIYMFTGVPSRDPNNHVCATMPLQL